MCACGMCCCCCYAMLSNKICMPFLTTTHDSRYGQNSAPPKKASGRRNCGAGPRASERTTVAAHARPDPYLRRRRPPSQTPISRRASVLVVPVLRTRAVALGRRADHAPRDQRSTAQAARRGSTRCARIQAAQSAERPRSQAPPAPRQPPPGAENALSAGRDDGCRVCDSGGRPANRATSARGPRSTFDFPVSALCAVRA